MPPSQSLCIGSRATPPISSSNVHDPARLRPREARFIDRLADRQGHDRAAAVRASMVRCLEDFLEDGWNVRLRAGAPSSDTPSDPVQTRALIQLFTNHWGTWSPAGVDASLAFPDDETLRSLLSRIEDMRTSPALFRAAAQGGGVWDRPLPPTLVAGIQRIDPSALVASLDRALDWHRWPRAGSGDRAAGLSRDAVYRGVNSILTFQGVLRTHPRATLQQLFERFSNHVTIWLAPRRQDRPGPVGAESRGQGPCKIRQSEMRTTVLPPTAPATMERPTAVPEPSRLAAAPPHRPDPPAFVDDHDLSAWLRRYAPFNPFKRRDSIVAPLLRDAIGLRLRASGPLRRRAAEKLLRATVEAADTISRGLERLGKDDARRMEADNERLKTLWRLIEDTRNRYDLPLPDPHSAPADAAARSWFPWRRRAQRQAQPE